MAVKSNMYTEASWDMARRRIRRHTESAIARPLGVPWFLPASVNMAVIRSACGMSSTMWLLVYRTSLDEMYRIGSTMVGELEYEMVRMPEGFGFISGTHGPETRLTEYVIPSVVGLSDKSGNASHIKSSAGLASFATSFFHIPIITIMLPYMTRLEKMQYMTEMACKIVVSARYLCEEALQDDEMDDGDDNAGEMEKQLEFLEKVVETVKASCRILVAKRRGNVVDEEQLDISWSKWRHICAQYHANSLP